MGLWWWRRSGLRVRIWWPWNWMDRWMWLCFFVLMFEDGKIFSLSNNMVRAQVALGCMIDITWQSCGCRN